jgi:hypothetical protein
VKFKRAVEATPSTRNSYRVGLQALRALLIERASQLKIREIWRAA